MAGTMRKPLENMRSFTERRKQLAEIVQDDVFIVASAPEAIRNHDVDHPYRQDSNMYYLTGFEEPESVLVFRPGRTPETVMFVRPRDIDKEVWNGFRFGPELVKQHFAVDAAFPIEEFDERIVGLLGTSANLYYRFYKNPEMDAKINAAIQKHQKSQGRSGLGLMGFKDADEVVGDMRRVKSDLEILNMRRACDISSDAHIALMKYVKPGMNEREAEGFFNYQLLKAGCARPGYNAIMAGGPNACVLHYVYNDQTMRKDELLLVDAAGEYNYLTSDITRTFPISGKFTEAQAEVYQAVLDVQKKMVDMVAPGVTMADLQEAGASLLTDAMLELGLFSGRKEDIMAANQHRKYYPHGIGHFLGMDVHDSGVSKTRQGMNRPLEPGCMLTIEPGIYIPMDDTGVAEKYRGIGIRIEDNILVTKDGNENMTEKCPKEIKDIEALMAQ